MIQLVIEAGDCFKVRSGGHTMAVESVADGRAVCVWIDKQSRLLRDTFDVRTLKFSRAKDEGAVGHIVRGTTRSSDAMQTMGLKH